MKSNNTSATMSNLVKKAKDLRTAGHFKVFSQRSAYEAIYIFKNDFANVSKKDNSYFEVRRQIDEALRFIFGNTPAVDQWCNKGNFIGKRELDYAMDYYFNIEDFNGSIVESGMEKCFGNLAEWLRRRVKDSQALLEQREKMAKEVQEAANRQIMQKALEMMEADAKAKQEEVEVEEDFFADL